MSVAPNPQPRARGVVRVDVGRSGARGGLPDDAVRRVVRMVLRAEGVRNARVSVALVSDAAIAGVNAAYLGRRRPTDVIAFALADPRGGVMGDIYIAPAVARRSAARYGVPVREEVTRLVVHGVLHVLGYDHPGGDSRVESPMWLRQEALTARAIRAARS